MVEVFKTNVSSPKQAVKIAYDCDRILRVEDNQINVEAVVQSVNSQGFVCTILED